MKIPSLLIALTLGFNANAQSQDGNGRLFETLLRGLAHVVTSENGSSLVPPPIPFDPHAGHAHGEEQSQASNNQHQGPSNRGWFQSAQPQVQPQPQVVNPTPPPRVIRQAAQTNQRPAANPFAGWYQAPQPQPEPQVQYYQPTQQVRPAPVTPFSNINPFQNQTPRREQAPEYEYHSHSDHGAQHSPQRGFFGQRQQQPSRSSRDEHHDHDTHSSHQQGTAPGAITIHSQFQPFMLFPMPQSRSVISTRSVRSVSTQGNTVWFRTR